MCKTAPKNEHVNPPLDLLKHQACNRCLSKLVLLLLDCLFLLHLSTPVSPFVERLNIIPNCTSRVRANVRESGGEVPSFEDLLVDKIAVVSTCELFGFPALLEERLRGLGEVCVVLEFGEGAAVEVVEVSR